ncbi:hypothetical protein ABFX02_04G160000 [Erythranthe guttata]
MGKRRMVGGGGGDEVNENQKVKICSGDRPLESVFASAPAKCYLDQRVSSGSRTMLSFGVNKSGNSLFQSFDQEENIGGEYLDEYFGQPEKKRRLSVEQVEFLERSFEADNKLEPERRVQLAKELGLQPRQIAIWFQNRRARWKTRRVETDYETLHASFKSLKNDYDNLLQENEMLKTEVLRLKENGLDNGTEKSNLKFSDTKEISQANPREAIDDLISEDDEAKVCFKNEEQSSAKSDLTNEESPLLTNGVSSYHFIEPDHSDLSQNGEDELKEDFFQLDYIFPTNEDVLYYGFPVEEDHAFDFW